MRIPTYRKHSSGQARVTINGRDYLLGKHGSNESRIKYHRLLAEYEASNKSPVFGESGTRLTMPQVILAFLNHAKKYYPMGREYEEFERTVTPISELYEDLLACKFGPMEFKACRSWWLSVHYHQFLRRGFSSNPNFDFLGVLARYRNCTGRTNKFRIAIDHRRLMRFADYRQTIERDTWYGPAFDREKLDDPMYVGLTVVGRICPNLLDSYPIERTEFLWKRNEGDTIKTLEIEELSSASSPYDSWHINRYAHAERDMSNQVFRHFDGAAKVYAQSKYPERIGQTMPNQPRCAHYVKMFRIDGEILLNDWLSLVGMFYKGNEMVIEYFDPELFDARIRPIRERMGQARLSSNNSK